MTILIRVFRRNIAVQVGQGETMWFHDWTHFLQTDVIRAEDTVLVQSWDN